MVDTWVKSDIEVIDFLQSLDLFSDELKVTDRKIIATLVKEFDQGEIHPWDLFDELVGRIFFFQGKNELEMVIMRDNYPIPELNQYFFEVTTNWNYCN